MDDLDWKLIATLQWKEKTMWDRFDLADITLQQLLDMFSSEYNLDITMLSSGVSLLYASFYPAKKNADRLPMRLSELVASVSKKPIESHVKKIIFEVTVSLF